ncbi:MAG: transglycosylase SLT domain-containing protein [Pseudomonadales bacterium]|nr:transglycosylase SLT domain-containing protein [Pseudomonadales bacterium]
MRGLLQTVVLMCCSSLAPLAQSADMAVDPVLRERLASALAEVHETVDRFDAEVWLRVSDQRLGRYIKSSSERLELLQLVYRESIQRGLDPDLVLAVMQIESAFNRYAISRVGAQGLMQVMPFWRLEIGRPQDNLTHVETNVRYGTVILAHYLDISKGDLVDALARYNGSRGRLKYPEKVIKAWRTRWRNKTREDLPDLQASCTNYGLNACQYQ